MPTPKHRTNEDSWNNLEISTKDLESLSSFLFETEEPLTSDGLVRVLVKSRFERQQAELKAKEDDLGRIYLPKESYAIGDKLTFPQSDWAVGEVLNTRAGINPQLGTFSVIGVKFDDDTEGEYASELETHPLNDATYSDDFDEEEYIAEILRSHDTQIKIKLLAALANQTDLVRIGSTWFPKSLLIDIGPGQRNLVEALLDSVEGGPMGTDALVTQLELRENENKRLLEFSLNYALQEDPRFEEVGTMGIISWFLKRLEPKAVLEVPRYLRVSPKSKIPDDLPEETQHMIASLNDELSPAFEGEVPVTKVTETSIILNFPHWRSGTLPITPLTGQVFPSALDTEHVKFTLRDQESDTDISAWVVRNHSYVYGLREWYEEQNLIPGSIIKLTATDDPAVIEIEAQKKRSNKEWIKTILVGADGGLVIALLRQQVFAGFNDRMAIAIPDLAAVDMLWDERQKKEPTLKADVFRMVTELSKLNTQRHVHFIDLYAALNLVRRTPPFDILEILNNSAEFNYVGDHYYHLAE